MSQTSSLLTTDIDDVSLGVIPAGGNQPNRFDVLEAWYPVHYVQDLDKSVPTKFTLLGRDIVIWWDNSSESWSVLEDKCPHRLAPLSEGRINEDGLLECPYHGWTFTNSGECQTIPQQVAGGQAESSKRACVKSLPTSVHQGLLFVYPGKAENAVKTKVPLVDALAEISNDWVCIDTFRDLPYDALTLLENVLDASHVPFTHHRSVGNRANAAPVELEVVESGKQGFTGKWEEGPRRGTLGRQDTTFIAPGLMWHDITSKQFGRTLTVVYATPIRKGECRLFARFPFKFASPFPKLVFKITPRWYSHIGQNSVLEDDQIFLHFQERYLQGLGGSENYAKAFYLPTAADRFVTELRRWVNEYAAEPFPGEALPQTSKTREQLMERYHSHTEKCGSCRQALARIKKIRTGIGFVGVMIWALIPLLNTFIPSSTTNIAIASFGFLVLVITWFQLGKLERKFYEGRLVPPRNLAEKQGK
ncbi:Rieske 2Fe-2S domain-containing protein [Calothrix sp. UHCC 0171]|uniref:aromatic ring-hydroxylating dioxygenase subunit alpha n=1 Tax=Calothrix sp. UHCC 0171 TaxID=3110245 RepID=UPI002B21B5E6|nr:Rieske 2Fe-2S domain-containing protein [Calothrix sp. UHCC 0171]MEA5572439.1 Rieske 2Fe-2S domain-containing protein [Calothrix sp. UHCC 0171]